MIREAARGFLQAWYDGGKGPEGVYQSGVTFDAKAWNSFATEQGMAGIAIDEVYGGAGLGDLGRVVVMEELGASMASMPFTPSCTISADVIIEFGTDKTKQEWLPKIASGEVVVAYSGGYDALSVEKDELSGAVYNVVHASDADLLLMSIRLGDGLQILGLPKGIAGLTITPQKTLDPTRSFADVALKDVPMADVVIIGEGTLGQLDSVEKISFISLAAECIGGAQKCLDMTLEYAGQRVQFDRPIASFQAIKHRCADMFIEIEAVRSATYAAAMAQGDEKIEAALIAKAYATDTFFKVAGDAIQLHGGIGFTWEYPLHFFFKRARANRSMFGTSSRDYVRIADLILGEAV